MKKATFLEQLKLDSNSEILYLCIVHMLDKVYKDDENFTESQIKILLSNYKNYHLYLNDFAGVIYNRYGSHINTIYIDMCDYLNIDVDNKYTLEHTIMKLEKQTPELLLGLTNEDIQSQTVEHFDEKLEAIEQSTHYEKNKKEFIKRVDKLYENINLVKNVLNKV